MMVMGVMKTLMPWWRWSWWRDCHCDKDLWWDEIYEISAKYWKQKNMQDYANVEHRTIGRREVRQIKDRENDMILRETSVVCHKNWF